MERLYKVAEDFVAVVSALLLLWLVASVVDVNMHNLSDYQYAQWNIFNILMEYF